MYAEYELIDKIDSGIIILDSGFEIIFWNAWMENKSGINRENTKGKKLNSLFSSEISSRLVDSIMLAINNGQSSILSDRFNKDLLPLMKDLSSNEIIDQKIKVSRVRTTNNLKHCLIQVFDVTTANQRESYLSQQNKIVKEQIKEIEHSNKLASLGRMASGIVHEINNPVAIIKGYDMAYEIMRKRGQFDQDKIDDMMKKIQQMADRISNIIKGLKIIAHKDTYEFNQLVPIKNIIDESIELSKPKIETTNVIVESDSIHLNYEIWCDPIQISQIIINLISNSIDAISEYPNPWIYISVKTNDKFYEIRVMDCGKGIPPHIVTQIFDPFYTSKKVGKGTGLGLSISQKIAEAHKGELYVDTNAPNTTFVLRLIQSKYWGNT